MASTYSDLKIQLMATGENSGTWGTITNTNLGTAIEEAITGSANVAFSSADVTLTLTNTNETQTARNLRLNLTGTSGGNRNLIVPAIEKVYIINNGLANQVTVKNAAGTGIAVPAGKTMYVYNNGTNVVDAVTHLTSLTLGSALPVASGGTGVSSSTGTGNVVLSTSPTLVTPALGTPASGVLTNATGLPIVAGTTGTLSVARGGTGATTLTGVLKGNGTSAVTASNVNLASEVTGTLPVANGGTGATTLTGVLKGNGTSAVTASNVNLTSEVTGTLPVANGGTGITSFGAGVATFLGTPSSANLAAAVTNETGTGALVFATSPTLVTPALGTPASGVLTNATGLPIVAGTTGTLSVARGGTGATTLTGVLKGNGTSAVTASNVNLTSEVTGTLPLANGGTNATTAGDAKANLGLSLYAENPSGTVTAPSISANNAIAIGNGAIVASSGEPRGIALGLSRASGRDALSINIGSSSSSFGATGFSGAIAIGQNATATGFFSSTAVGAGAVASQSEATAIGGSTASGSRSIALGAGGVASAEDAKSIGNGARALSVGKFAFASNTTAGAAQSGKYVLRRTIESSPLRLFTNGMFSTAGDAEILLSNNSAYAFHGTVVGKETGSTTVGAWEVKGVIVRGADASATTLLASTVTALVTAPAFWDLTLSADTTDGTLVITGTADDEAEFVATIETTEVIT